jgi:hypothetical protein
MADLYQLLVYDPGSFCVSHRDTEKAAGMFAPLIIVLPSIYTGGALLVRHRDREARLELRGPEPSQVAFAAFDADCVHEGLPLTAGYRLALVSNRRRQGRGQGPEPPPYAPEQARVTALLRQWSAGKAAPEDDSPDTLLSPLAYAYTPAELACGALQGADAAVAEVRVAAASAAACDLHLALVSITESGRAEHLGYYGARRRGWSDEADAEDFEVGEVYERSEPLSDWRRPDGSQPALGAVPFLADERCPPEAFEDLKPDEQYCHEAAGNEGASFERTYRRAALVLWPPARRLVVLNQTGLAATLPYLGELTERWATSGAGPASPLWREAHEFSGHMLRTWPRQVGWYPERTEARSDAARLLTLLSQLEDTARIEALLDILAAGAYSKGDNAAIVQAVGLLPPERVAAVIKHLIASHTATYLSACSDLLARSVAVRVTRHVRRSATSGAAHAPWNPASSSTSSLPWGRSMRPSRTGRWTVSWPGPRPTSRMPSSSPLSWG